MANFGKLAQESLDHLSHSMELGNSRTVNLRGLTCPKCRGTTTIRGSARFQCAEIKAGARVRVYEIFAICSCGHEGITGSTFRITG